MKYFTMFTGIGGAELGIRNIKLSNENGSKTRNKNVRGCRTSIKQENGVCSKWKKSSLCVGMCEIDKYASQVLQQRFKGVKNYGDATKISTKEIPDFDLLVAGFPCQAFSIAGKRRGFKDTRGTMFFEVARILKAKRPKYCVLENVKGLLSHDKGNTFSTILITLQKLGYSIEWGVLNTRYFGIPQNRERVYIVGVFGEQSRGKVFPIQRAGTTNLKPIIYANKSSSQHDRIYSEEGISPTLAGASKLSGDCTPKIKISNASKREIGFKDFCPSLLSRDYKDPKIVATACLTPFRANKRQNGRRFKNPEEPCFTLTSRDIHVVKQEQRIRRLTPTECELLQGFPKGWTDIIMNNNKRMSDTQRYKMMGNAMSVPVVGAVIEALLN